MKPMPLLYRNGKFYNEQGQECKADGTVVEQPMKAVEPHRFIGKREWGINPECWRRCVHRDVDGTLCNIPNADHLRWELEQRNAIELPAMTHCPQCGVGLQVKVELR